MWLKPTTIILIIFSIVLLFAYPWAVGQRPVKGSPKAEQVAYLRRGAIYVGVEALALIGAITTSYLIARRARQEYLDQSSRNMEALLEATLRDHARRNEVGDGDSD